ncbi:uroporphyrinogen-III synthase [Thioclava sp. FR2]|uniref:uroporphyrinogen-III synthase n=1 Tax=Thioclava sp. FR2 TaxID=3445780 RepID=UPI003EBD1E2C
MGGNTACMPLQSRAIPVIITRPEPQANRFAQEIRRDLGNKAIPIISPLLQLRFSGNQPPDHRFGALVLTSEMGAQSALRLREEGVIIPDLAYCVGDRTAQVARQNGFLPVSASGDARDLVSLLLEHRKDAPFLHLHGQEARGDIVGKLTAQNVEAIGLVTYFQEPLCLTEEAKFTLSKDGEVFVPLFSPRTARIWAQEISKFKVLANLSHFALSPAVAEELKGLEPVHLEIADNPTQESIRHMMSQALNCA